MSQISHGYDNNSPKNEPHTIPDGDSLHAPLPYIPFDLIIEILSRVPVKSLIQFKCVCKSWKTLISNPEFAKKNFSTIDHHHHLLLKSNDTLDNFIVRSYSLPSIFETSPPISNQVSYPLNTQNCFDIIIGSCDGILCFAVNISCALLWNPAIGAFKKLPPLKKYNIFGFGFDQCSDSYKVVAILRRRHSSDGRNAYTTKVKIHNLGTDSWRRIKEYPSGIPIGLAAKLVSGTLNWMASIARNVTSFAIMSLDLGKESCQELLQPDFGEVNVLTFRLGVLKNCLSIIVLHEEGFTDVWLMNDYGKKESWTKFLSFPCLGDLNLFPYAKVICIYEDENVLFEYDSVLTIYNIRNRTFKFPEMPDFGGRPFPQIYVESLISPCVLKH
ncbi:unnamed protein product [Lupinus luteus]|uniref:F-box domain-containing protein n=1 Tax=Lupinus luteus TaxID=3873 RepID=A0AAV1YNJ4_LUPLU